MSEEPVAEKTVLLKTVDVLLEKTGLATQLKKDGDRYTGNCPFCGQAGFSFHVPMETYSCQSCKESGNALKFVVKYLPAEARNTVDAWNWLAEAMFDGKAKGKPVDMTGWIEE